MCEADLDEIPVNNVRQVCTEKMVVHYVVTVTFELMYVGGGCVMGLLAVLCEVKWLVFVMTACGSDFKQVGTLSSPCPKWLWGPPSGYYVLFSWSMRLNNYLHLGTRYECMELSFDSTGDFHNLFKLVGTSLML